MSDMGACLCELTLRPRSTLPEESHVLVEVGQESRRRDYLLLLARTASGSLRRQTVASLHRCSFALRICPKYCWNLTIAQRRRRGSKVRSTEAECDLNNVFSRRIHRTAATHINSLNECLNFARGLVFQFKQIQTSLWRY